MTYTADYHDRVEDVFDLNAFVLLARDSELTQSNLRLFNWVSGFIVKVSEHRYLHLRIKDYIVTAPQSSWQFQASAIRYQEYFISLSDLSFSQGNVVIATKYWELRRISSRSTDRPC